MMKRYKSIIYLLIAVALLSLFSSGCSSDSSSKTSKSKEIVYASTVKPVGLSPTLTNDVPSSNIIDTIYEPLFERNVETGAIEPCLAASYETPDENTWVIKLRENIKFHDGTPFNAEAVKYTFDKLKDPATAAPRASLLAPVTSIEVQDELTVVLKTDKPYGPMLAALSHTNANIISPTADQKQDLMTNPVGTGPFKFVKKENGDDVVVEKNKDYWREAAKINKLTFKVVPDINTAISMLETGEVQFIDGVPADSMPRVKKINSVKIEEVKGTQVYYMVLNTNKGPAKDKKFREAVAYALDIDAYVNKLNGLGYKSKSFIGPEVFGYDASVESMGILYDLEKAKQLVKEGNFGAKKFKMLTANTPVYLNIAEALQAQLTEAGFKVELEMMEWGAYLDESKKGEFDVTLSAWSNVTMDGSELLYPRLHSANAGSSNSGHYKNPELDKLIEASRTTIDEAGRKKELKAASELILEDLPVLPIYHGVNTIVFDKSISGIELFPNGDWSISKASRK